MENRMKLIYDAAGHLFINKGYARTQMKDIAKEINLSTGMLYVYFTGKKDILSFLLKATIKPDFILQDFEYPITSELFASLEQEVMDALEENTKQFEANLPNESNYPVEQMLSDAFDIISKYGIGCLLIEKNPDAVGVLIGYYKDYRKRFFQNMLSYIQHYMDNGTFRKVEYPRHCAQLIIETLSWWGMHVMNNAFEIQKDIPLQVAKSVCLDSLIHAYKI